MQENIQQPTTPTLDLNALLTAALAQVINQATAPLLARIEVLERSLVVADDAAQGNESGLFSRVALLEDKMDNIKLSDASEERIKEIADEVARDVMSEHVGDYDHDMYDRLEDKIDEIDVEDAVRDALRGMTFDITPRF